MREFDDDELFSRAGRDAVYPVLDELRPKVGSEPVLARHGAGLIVSYRTHGGCAIVVIRSCLVFRYGYPSLAALGRHRLYDQGLGDLGIYLVGDSSTLREAHLSWVGQPIPTSDAWNGRHYTIAFTEGLLECLGNYLSYDLFPADIEPSDLVAQRLTPGSNLDYA